MRGLCTERYTQPSYLPARVIRKSIRDEGRGVCGCFAFKYERLTKTRPTKPANNHGYEVYNVVALISSGFELDLM